MARELKEKYYVPIWLKVNLTVEETAAYTGIGRDKLYKLTSQDDCPFVLRVGGKRLIKREEFCKYLKTIDSL
ncbi:excisionase [Frisingicoccus sp.]